jgi:hypothetical protein
MGKLAVIIHTETAEMSHRLGTLPGSCFPSSTILSLVTYWVSDILWILLDGLLFLKHCQWKDNMMSLLFKKTKKQNWTKKIKLAKKVYGKRGPGTREKVRSKRINLEGNTHSQEINVSQCPV